MLNWLDLSEELRRTCPDKFEYYHVEANHRYEEINQKNVRASVEYNAMNFVFTDKFKDKYKVTIRVLSDKSVNVSVKIKGNGLFEYPVTNEDELFDKRMDLYGPSAVKDNTSVRNELKEIYDWTFNAYRNVS